MYNLHSCYVVNGFYGGYSYRDKHGHSVMVSYADARDVVKLAKEHGQQVHLAGTNWQRHGYHGWGQPVDADTAALLIEKDRQRLVGGYKYE